MRLSVPRLGGYTRRGESLCFRPRDRTRPYWGRGRRGRRPTTLQPVCEGMVWAEPKGPYARGLALYCPRYEPEKHVGH